MLESATALLTTTNAQHAEATYYLALAQVHAFSSPHARPTLELICVDSPTGCHCGAAYQPQRHHATTGRVLSYVCDHHRRPDGVLLTGAACAAAGARHAVEATRGRGRGGAGAVALGVGSAVPTRRRCVRARRCRGRATEVVACASLWHCQGSCLLRDARTAIHRLHEGICWSTVVVRPRCLSECAARSRISKPTGCPSISTRPGG